MTATLLSLDPYTTGPTSLILSVRAASLTCAAGRQSIGSKELHYRSILVVENGERTMFCMVARSRKSAVEDLETCFGLPSQ
jgi:hypothetical protein